MHHSKIFFGGGGCLEPPPSRSPHEYILCDKEVGFLWKLFTLCISVQFSHKSSKSLKTIFCGGNMIRPFVMFLFHFHFEEIITAPWSEFYKRLKSANVSWTKMFWFHGCTSQNVAPAYYYNCRNMDFIKSVVHWSDLLTCALVDDAMSFPGHSILRKY